MEERDCRNCIWFNKEIENSCGNYLCKNKSEYDELPKAMAGLLEEEEEIRWIPIEEKLPKPGTWVLAYCADDDFMYLSYQHTFEDFEVTHWMPLPPKPKGAFAKMQEENADDV